REELCDLDSVRARRAPSVVERQRPDQRPRPDSRRSSQRLPNRVFPQLHYSSAASSVHKQGLEALTQTCDFVHHDHGLLVADPLALGLAVPTPAPPTGGRVHQSADREARPDRRRDTGGSLAQACARFLRALRAGRHGGAGDKWRREPQEHAQGEFGDTWMHVLDLNLAKVGGRAMRQKLTFAFLTWLSVVL